MTEDDKLFLWNGEQVTRQWLVTNAPHLAQYMQHSDSYREVCAIGRGSFVWQHTKTSLIVFCFFVILLFLPSDTSKDVSIVGSLAVFAFVTFLAWLIMLPQSLWLSRLNSHKIHITDGKFTYTRRVFRKESSYSAPLNDIKWQSSSTKHDAWFRTMPHKKRKCIIAEIPIHFAGLRISCVRVACGLTDENKAVLDEFIAVTRQTLDRQAFEVAV